MNKIPFFLQNLFFFKLPCQGQHDVSLHTSNMTAFQTQNVYNKNEIYLIKLIPGLRGEIFLIRDIF